MIVVRAVRLAVEIVAVALAAASGLHAASGPTRWLVALAGSAVVSVIWGRYVAPKSPARLLDPARLAVEIGLFLAVASASASVSAVSTTFAAGFAAVAIGDAIALRICERRHRT